MTKTVDYSAMSARLDEVLTALQAPDIAIDEALKLHEEGSKIVADLQTYLETAENNIKKLTTTDA
jgi:exodeoxyribonuclease VII small subunit